MASKTIFVAHGPVEIPYYQGRAGRTITDEDVKKFWKVNVSVGKQRGCYVFGVRAGKGMTPGYVGKATRNFKNESFAPHKLTRYQQFLTDYKKGTPIIFFLFPQNKKGAPNVKHIEQLESFLIQIGVAANPNLLNIRGTKEEEWGISGILRAGSGQPSVHAKKFSAFMKI